MPHLEPLRKEHAPAVLSFELENRAYFAAWITDRGDAYFEQFAQRHEALLSEQADGIGAFYVLVAEDESILGRFNLTFGEDGAGELGYRVAQDATGRGVATVAVKEICRLAAARHGIRLLRAATAGQNAASRKVLTNAGFIPAGAADPVDLGGQQGTWYQRDLGGVEPPTA